MVVRRAPWPWGVRMWVELFGEREEGWVALWGGGEGVEVWVWVESVVGMEVVVGRLEEVGSVTSISGRSVVAVERREVGRWEEVGTGTGISGAYISGFVSRRNQEGGLGI